MEHIEEERDESPYERIMREGNEKHLKQLEAFAAAKTKFKYGILRVSRFRYSIVKYMGPSYYGDFDLGNGFFMHNLEFVDECQNLTHESAEKIYKELIK